MRFLFTTIQGFESEFYGRVAAKLEGLGHTVGHVTVSELATERLRHQGFQARALPEVVAGLPPFDTAGEVARIVKQYDLADIRELYRADPASERLPEGAAIRRTVEHVLAFEQILDDEKPGVLIPEVGRELPRTVAHMVAQGRGVHTFFLFYTIFPNALRLSIDAIHGPIVGSEALRDLGDDERAEVLCFRSEFLERAEPIRAPRRQKITRQNVARFIGYLRAKTGRDRRNEYLRPLEWASGTIAEHVRAPAARLLCDDVDLGRPFVYFPLHDTEDYKIKQVIPQFADQRPVVNALADALPAEVDLVIKEHPQTIGRNRLSLLKSLKQRPNVRLVDPRTSTHELLRAASAVVVIGSTVGLEALLHEKPVLTLGRPFYSGYGLTIDVDSPDEIVANLDALLAFRPDPELTLRFLHAAMRACYAGAPVLVDQSDENAERLAVSLDTATQTLPRVRERV